jgi:hypothetical protein
VASNLATVWNATCLLTCSIALRPKCCHVPVSVWKEFLSAALNETSGFHIASLQVMTPYSHVGVTNLSEEDISLIFRVRLRHRKSHITRNHAVA